MTEEIGERVYTDEVFRDTERDELFRIGEMFISETGKAHVRRNYANGSLHGPVEEFVENMNNGTYERVQ